MAPEKRGTLGTRYYYRVEREGRKVRKTYLGPCAEPVVGLLARVDRLNAAQACANRAEVGAEDDEKWEASILEFHQTVDAFTVAKLVVRRQPQPHEKASQKLAKKEGIVMKAKVSEMPTEGEFKSLVKRANQGAATAQSQLKNLMEEFPIIWQQIGNLGQLVENHLLDVAGGGSFMVRESLRHHLEELRQRLALDRSDPLKNLLVDRVVGSWLEVQVQQIHLGQHHNLKDEKLQQRRLDQAQSRHLEAMRALAEHQRAP